MSDTKGESRLIARAIRFAARAHRGQIRKVNGIPYVWHPLAVGRTLTDYGCRVEVIAAGILHDTIEDTDATKEDLVHSFGKEVADLVEFCSEPAGHLRWEERKLRSIRRICRAPRDARIVAAADKLDNVSSMAVDLDVMGESIWDRFIRGRDSQAWYYRSMSRAIRRIDPEGKTAPGPDADGHPLFDRLDFAVSQLFG